MNTGDDEQPSHTAAAAEGIDHEKLATGAQQPDGTTDAVQEKSQPADQQHTDHILNKHEGEGQNADSSKTIKEGGNEKKDASKGKDQNEKKDEPAGGFDSTPIPKPPSGAVGYTLKITFHNANNLAIGDAQTFSSDPYVLAQLNTDIDPRHKEDPRLRFRSFTVRRTTNAEWNENWIVANVPSSGFKLKMRVYDEDPADHDDLLGKAAVTVPSISDSWRGIQRESYKLSLAQSSKRAVMVRGFATCFGIVPRHLKGDVVISIENLGRTGQDGQGGRPYTVGECRWFRHHSPLLGRLTNTKGVTGDAAPPKSPDSQQKKQIQHYNFQANQIQLQGPVPPELYHRFVEFKPWVKRMFTTTGFQGVLLGKALHHQHARVYSFGRSTAWGHFPEGPSEDLTRKFLELVHYDQGGSIFTYVLTLDALWRFTETGKEFGIDMLSKHTMHSDVSIYIAFSGEFFIRRLKHRHRPPPPHPTESTSHQATESHQPNESLSPEDIEEEEPPKDPKYYELFIGKYPFTNTPHPIRFKTLTHWHYQTTTQAPTAPTQECSHSSQNSCPKPYRAYTSKPSTARTTRIA